MIEHYKFFGQAVLVYIFFSRKNNIESVQEFRDLVISSGVKIFQIIIVNRRSPHPKFFVGIGKAQEIALLVKNYLISVIIFNHILSLNQERNLEDLCECKIIDRTELILNIFAQRAYTNEGKLQVRLAQLQHLSTRLVHGWSHLERQKGGLKRIGGPGETQLEIDRRLLRLQINNVCSRLKKVEKQHEQARRFRIQNFVPTFLLIGYTNAGKSTFFNLLTRSSVRTADSLFTTLDSVYRRVCLHGIGEIVLIDTVGFITNLPADLISAFRVTLKEALYAKMLLHIVDSSDDRCIEKSHEVVSILNQIKFDHVPLLTVMNKIDQLPNIIPHIDRNSNNFPIKVWLSAKNNLGIPLFVQALSECLCNDIVEYELILPLKFYYIKIKLYAMKAIENCWFESNGNVHLIIRLPIWDWFVLCKQNSFLVQYVV